MSEKVLAWHRDGWQKEGVLLSLTGARTVKLYKNPHNLLMDIIDGFGTIFNFLRLKKKKKLKEVKPVVSCGVWWGGCYWLNYVPLQIHTFKS